jgi:hypothetical protein
MSGNGPQIHPIHIPPNGLLSYHVRIALFLRLWRIASTAVLALKTLATDFCKTDFNLTGAFLAVRTFIHSLTLPYILSFSHSLLQRSLARKEKGGKNRKKTLLKVQRQHEHVKNQRRDFAHKLSYTLAHNYDLISCEDLKIANSSQVATEAEIVRALQVQRLMCYLRLPTRQYQAK